MLNKNEIKLQSESKPVGKIKTVVSGVVWKMSFESYNDDLDHRHIL